MGHESDMSDVIVVGAGISGLLCARDLLKQGFRVRVLEASERVGGRTYSVHFGDQRLDLGGQWIAPKQQQPQIRELIEDLGLEVHPQHYAGKRILDLHCLPGPLQYSSDIPSGIGLGGLLMVQLTLWFCTLRARLSVGSGAPMDVTGKFARLDQQSTGEVLGKLVGNSGAGATRALVTAMVRGVFGCEPEELSWLHFLHYVACAGGVERLLKINHGFQESTVKGGAQQISEGLAEQVLALGGTVDFKQPVTSVVCHQDSVELHCKDAKFRCSRCVFAMPPVRLGDIHFTPQLPASRAALHGSNFIGCIIKSVFRYERPFWRLQGFSGEVVAEATDEEPCFNCYDHCLGDRYFLVCFMNGAPAQRWSQRSEEERRAVLLQQLTKWFGAEAKEALEYIEKDWAADEFTKGCPVGCYPPNTLAPHMQALRTPCGLLYWAGTEAAERCQGFMEGAVDAAQRVVKEVSQSLAAAKL